jgi:hypothetical protein
MAREATLRSNRKVWRASRGGWTVVAAVALALGMTWSASAYASAHSPVSVSVSATSHNRSGSVSSVRADLRGGTAIPAVMPLTYHGGPVQHSSSVYAIFWTPPSYVFPAGYTDLVSRYFTDVAHDSFKTSNVYAVTTQYYDVTAGVKQFVSYSVGSHKAIIDTDPLPPDGCSNYVLADGSTSKNCIIDTQLDNEINAVIAAHHLPKGLATDYFMFTPPGLASCHDANGVTDGCFDPVPLTGYCSFHRWTSTTPSAVLYSFMAYPAVAGGCDSGQAPNGNATADGVLSEVSAEQIAMITDPVGNGWRDSAGNESQNKCFGFGTPIGVTGTGKYNELINGHPYYLSEEWTNRLDACVQRNTFLQPTALFTYLPVGPKRGTRVKFTVTVHDSDDTKFTYRWTFPHAVSSNLANPTFTFSTAGANTVTLIVYDAHGDQTEVAKAITVT